MKRKPLILISLLLAAFVINLDTTIVNVALPSLVRELHASTRSCSGSWTRSTWCSLGRCWPRAACLTGSGARGCCSLAYGCSVWRAWRAV